MKEEIEDFVAIPCPKCERRIEKPLSWWKEAVACPHCFEGGRLILISHLFKVYMNLGQVYTLHINIF